MSHYNCDVCVEAGVQEERERLVSALKKERELHVEAKHGAYVEFLDNVIEAVEAGAL